MKFVLTYDGELRSSGNGSRKSEAKWAIRMHFEPQLKELWLTHPALVELSFRRYMPRSGMMWIEGHHSVDYGRRKQGKPDGDDIDLLAPIRVGSRWFCPLIRETLALSCDLKIVFLRKETPGKVYQGGDLDNRIKTLLDALCVPNDPSLVIGCDDDDASPVFCLLEDDALISGLSVQTHTLLSAPNAPASQVRLLIEVDVKVTKSRAYNSVLLGD